MKTKKLRRQLFWIVLIKIVALYLLWFLFIKPLKYEANSASVSTRLLQQDHQVTDSLTQLINFKTLQRAESPNNYLLAPEKFTPATIDQVSPVLEVDLPTLSKRWHNLISKEPRLEIFYQNAEQDRYGYVIRSLIFRFPDTVNVQLISLGSEQSTLAIYSYSNYGHSDFGVNKKRVQSWLKQLES